MNIGDLYWTFRGDGARLEADAKKAGAAAGKTASSSFSSLITKGIGVGLGIGVFNLATSALTGVADAAWGAAKAAIGEQVNIVKLGAALKANVANWDGNTDAIEATIAAREKLAFSDDSLRQSMALLIPATKDVNKALELQEIAMNLSRLRGTDLAETSTLISKVYQGNLTSLKRFGISLKGVKTSTEALAAIQKLAAGQAEAYGESTQGSMESAQIAIDDVVEDIGSQLLPIIKELAEFVRDDVVPAIRDLGKQIDDVNGSLKDFGGLAGLIGIVWTSITTGGLGTARAMAEAKQSVIENTRAMDDELARKERSLTTSLNGVSASMGDMADDSEEATKTVQKSFGEMVDDMITDAGRLIDDVYGPTIAKQQLAADKAEAAAIRQSLASGKLTKDEIRDARQRLVALKQSADEQRLALLESGDLTASDTDAWLKKLRKQYKTATGSAKGSIQQLINKIEELRRLRETNVRINLYERLIKENEAKGKHKQLAAGGPVAAGGSYIVGERGPELVTPQRAGWVHDAASTRAMLAAAASATGGGGGAMTVNIGRVDRSTMPDAIRELRRIDDVRRMRVTTQ